MYPNQLSECSNGDGGENGSGGKGRVRSGSSFRSASVEDDVSVLGVQDEDLMRKMLDRSALKFVHEARGERDYVENSMSVESDNETSVSAEDRAEARVRARAEDFELLRDCADRLGRISKVQMTTKFKRGRPVASAAIRTSLGPQLVFGLEGAETIDDLEHANGLYERINKGRVVTQIVAKTGIGKTSRFAGLVANKCNARVLLLQPETTLCAIASESLSTITKVVTRWSNERYAAVTVMTYHDFCAHWRGDNGQRMMQQFDVIIADEAHLPLSYVYVTKAILATSDNKCSIIIMSATYDGIDSQALNAAEPVKEFRADLVKAVADGAFSKGTRCLDRTMFIMVTDEQVQQSAEVMRSHGHVAHVLDSASRAVDYRRVVADMSGDSLVKRFLFAVERFGTGYNLPVSQVYTMAARKTYSMDDRRVVNSKIIPVTVSEVKQHSGRVGRGIVRGASAHVSNQYEPVPDVDLLSSERMEAYMMLRAATIEPLASVKPDSTFIPFGVTPEVASSVLNVNLPVELAVRYFAADGRIPAGFSRALAPFCAIDSWFVTSDFETPIGYDDWVKVPVGGFLGIAKSEHAFVTVPFVSNDDHLNAIMQAISAVALGRINVVEFKPKLSDDEEHVPRVNKVGVNKTLPRLPRLVENDAAVRPSPARLESSWSFDAPYRNQLSLSYIHSASSTTFEEAQSLLRVVDEPVGNYNLANVNRRDVIEVRSQTGENVETASQLDEPKTPVEVSTPGGSVIVRIAVNVWERMSKGRSLSADEAYRLFRDVRHNPSGFANSTAFSAWSNVWVSVLKTMASKDALERLQAQGLINTALAVMYELYTRYTAGVKSVVESSLVRSKFWSRVLRGHSLEQAFSRAKDKGEADVMQSEAWFRRVYEIRELSALVLTMMSEKGYHTPTTFSKVQEVLPISRSLGNKTLDKALNHVRGKSNSTLRIGGDYGGFLSARHR